MEIERKGGVLELRFAKKGRWLPRVRALPDRRFDADRGVWVVPYTRENFRAMQAAGFPLDGLKEPSASSYQIDAKGTVLLVRVPGDRDNLAKCRKIPGNRLWDQRGGVWKAKASRQNVEYLATVFPSAYWTETALAFRDDVDAHIEEREQARAMKERVIEAPEIKDFRFKTEPYAHQAQVFLLSRDKKAYALHMEMGTGKTKVVIDTAAWLWLKKEINGVLVVAPISVKDVWAEEIAMHLPDYVERRVHIYSSGMGKTERAAVEALNAPGPGLDILVVNVEGLSTVTAPKVCEAFLEAHDAMMVVDESTRIKNPKAKRTKRTLKLSRLARYKRTMSGTPITQGPLDAFAPFHFLDPKILGFRSIYAFRNHFAVMGGYDDKEVVGYRNLEELQELIDPWSFRVTKDECLDLPPKVYERIVVNLSEEQRRLYDEMAEHMVACLSESLHVTAAIVLTKLLRLQQIVGGFVAVERTEEQEETFAQLMERIAAGEDFVKDDLEPHLETVAIDGPNPKVDALLELAEDVEGKILIWARFRPEIEAISTALRGRFGEESVVEFHGGVSEDDRTRARRSFQDATSGVRFFVGNQQTGGLGLTLTEAQTVVYYSNSFSLEERLQSEDRAHRSGLRHSVTYVDLVAKDTLDTKLILPALRGKREIANVVTGDIAREWI